MRRQASDQTTSPAARDLRIDALRGLAIALIVLQHVGWVFVTSHHAPGMTETFAGRWANESLIGSPWSLAVRVTAPFAVGLFAFLTGYLILNAVKRPLATFCRDRFIMLMVPYIAWNVLYQVLPVTNVFLNKAGVLGSALESLYLPGAGSRGPLWYLYVLFVSAVLFHSVAKLSTRASWLGLTAASSLLVPHVLGFLNLPPWFGLWEISFVYPFLVAGYLSRRRGLSPSAMPRWFLWPSLAAFVALLWIRLGLWVAPLPSQHEALRYALVVVGRDEVFRVVLGLSGIAVCFGLARVLRERLLQPLAFLGRYSIGICAAQLPVIAVLATLRITSPSAVLMITLALSLTISVALDSTRVSRVLFLGGRSARRPSRQRPEVWDGGQVSGAEIAVGDPEGSAEVLSG